MNRWHIYVTIFLLASVASEPSAFVPMPTFVVIQTSSTPYASPSFLRSRNTALAAMEVKIRLVGRKGDKWIEEAIDMYQKRLRAGNIDVETVWYKSDDALVKGVTGDYQKGRPVVLLDPQGRSCSSEELTTDFYKWMEQGGSRLSFVIGGAEGLPPDLRLARPPPLSSVPVLLSLSSLTFTHQFARLLLVEQIYRASEIRKGSDYHK